MDTPAARLSDAIAHTEDTQAEVARRISTGEAYLSKVAAGDKTLTHRMARRLAPVLGVSADWLLTGEGEREPPGHESADAEKGGDSGAAASIEERAAMAHGSAVADRQMVIMFLGAKCPRCRQILETGTEICPRCLTTLEWPPIGNSEPKGGANE